MSEQMRAEFEKEAKSFGLSLRTVEGSTGYYWNNETNLAWNFYQLGYAAGRKAERETIRKLISWQVVAPLIKLSERVNEAMQRSKPEGER